MCTSIVCNCDNCDKNINSNVILIHIDMKNLVLSPVVIDQVGTDWVYLVVGNTHDIIVTCNRFRYDIGI